MQRLSGLRRRLSGQAGFTMPAVMIGMFLAGLFSLAAISGVVGDIPIARGDQDHKRAHEAAEAGLAWYQFQLAADPAYWTKCTNVPNPSPSEQAPVNQVWNGVGADPRKWRFLPGSSDAKYAIELIPANGQTACDPSKPQTTMLQNNTLRIRSTGWVRGKKRSIVATFKRKSFLDYVYFTNLETIDPVTYSDAGMRAWAQGTSTTQGQCEKYWRDGRGSSSYFGNYCTEIQFITGDQINGPFHTNDSILTNGSPIFGRTSDKIEMTGGAPTGYRTNGGGTPVFRGPKTVPAAPLDLPPDNASLKTLADPAYRFTGKTSLVFQDDKVLVTNAAVGTNVPMALPPPNGIIYVSNGACGKSYTLQQNYTDIPDGCGNAWVQGTYSKGVTVAAENDVIINADLVHTGDGLLGLIANQFVRVFHPVVDPTNSSTSNRSDDLGDVRIDAAILSLQHSFIVDNYSLGAAEGTLTVNGAIAQNFRGPVGSTDGSGRVHGYIKNYTYDDRLAYEEPPNFLDPIQTAWRMVRATEQTPPR